MSGLYAMKPWFLRRLRGIEDVLVERRVRPDTLTIAAVVVSGLAGIAVALGGLLHAPMLWMLVLPLAVVRLALNALDGSVARRTRTARPFGAALNEVSDRIGDAATIGATSFVAGPKLGLGALACAFFVSFTGVLALALTGRRDAAGPMGKADRALLLGGGALVGAITGSAIPLVVVLWSVIFGSVLTAYARVRRLAERRNTERHEPVFIELSPAPVVEEEMTNAFVR